MLLASVPPTFQIVYRLVPDVAPDRCARFCAHLQVVLDIGSERKPSRDFNHFTQLAKIDCAATRTRVCTGQLSWNSRVKEGNEIALGLSDSTAAADFKYSMSGKIISITYLGTRSIHQEIGRILRRIEHWHQGAVTSYRILYQDAAGLGGEVKRTERMRKLSAAI